jgi:hypothetical protein
MRPYQASLINSVILIIFGIWGFVETMGGDTNKSALIAPIFGLILLILNFGLKKENKIVAHIAVLLTLMISMALIYPLWKTVCPNPNDITGLVPEFNMVRFFRISIMLLSSFIAMATFIKSFIEARRNK